MIVRATATFTGRDALMRFVEARVTPAVRASVDAACQLVVQEAKQIVPVDTGELRDSIGYEVKDTEKSVVGNVSATANHAGYVEYGTGIRGASSAGAGPYPYSATWPGMSAQPYMRPALDIAREPIRELFRSQIALRIKE